MSPLTMIAAYSKVGRFIGKGGQLPWGRIPEDMAHFKQMTMGKAIIMGRKTSESIGRPLPGRTNIVCSRDPSYVSVNFPRVFGSLAAALGYAEATTLGAVVIGGGELYRQALPLATHLILTEIDLPVDGDVTFPELDDNWKEHSAVRQGTLTFREFLRPAGYTYPPEPA